MNAIVSTDADYKYDFEITDITWDMPYIKVSPGIHKGLNKFRDENSDSKLQFKNWELHENILYYYKHIYFSEMLKQLHN